MSNLDTLVGEVREFEKKRKAVSKTAVPIIKAELKAFLEAHPEVDALRWQQYVPGFNDGDPCTFSLCDLQLRLLETEEEQEDSEEDAEAEEDDEYEDEDSDEEWIDACSTEQIENKKLKAAFKKFSDRFAELEPILEEAFGSNAQITATRKKITVEDYDCGF